MGIRELLAEGRTIDYQEIPDALWAATGYRISNVEHWQRFGRLRNMIVHLAVPEEAGTNNLRQTTFRFAFEVVEPMVWDFWNADIIEYYERLLEEDIYILEAIEKAGIKFTRRKAQGE